MKETKLEDELTKLGAEKWIETQLREIRRKKEGQNTLKRVNDLESKLLRAVPDCPAEIIGDVAIDLGDLVNVGSRHRRHVNAILKLSGRQIEDQLATLLIEIEINLLSEAQFHLKSLKKKLPKLQAALRKASRERSSKEKDSEQRRKK